MEKQQGRWKRQIKWMKEGMKNFRLSLSLRVSLNYLRFFLINGIIFFFILGFLYVHEEMKPTRTAVEQMVVLLEMDENKFVDYVVKEQPQKKSGKFSRTAGKTGRSTVICLDIAIWNGKTETGS